ncbi:MAG: tyrosine-type recombinase/integrase [Candidatus Izemoplasmatales bacterium]
MAFSPLVLLINNVFKDNIRIRDTFASLLFQNGANLKTVQMLLGHKSIKTTEIYLHLSDSFIQSDYDKHFPIV